MVLSGCNGNKVETEATRLVSFHSPRSKDKLWANRSNSARGALGYFRVTPLHADAPGGIIERVEPLRV
jgi:hypothetical protein